jgi:hypothetical protein
MKEELIKVIAEYLENNAEIIAASVKHGNSISPAAAIADKFLPIVGEKYLPLDELSGHMYYKHGLILDDGQLGDIIHIARGK